MAEENKTPITTTQFANQDRDRGQVEFGKDPKSPNDAKHGESRDQSNDQTVTVKALRRFHKEENMQGEMLNPGDTFDVSRSRAAELRANGLIEYASDSDEKAIHGEAGAKALADKAKADAESRKLVEKNKTSPLRNPKLELGEVKDKPSTDK